jgi:hypothetical protein
MSDPQPGSASIETSFAPFRERMQSAGLSESAIRAFRGSYAALLAGETGMIPEDTIKPADELPLADELTAPEAERASELLRRTVLIKLNGGLGTGMGLEKAKSLLPVRGEVEQCDQHRHLDERGRGEWLVPQPFEQLAGYEIGDAVAHHPAVGIGKAVEGAAQRGQRARGRQRRGRRSRNRGTRLRQRPRRTMERREQRARKNGEKSHAGKLEFPSAPRSPFAVPVVPQQPGRISPAL